VKRFTETTSPQKLNSNLVSQVVQDKDKLIWVATDHGGITLIDKKNNFAVSHILNDVKDSKSISQNSINSLFRDDQNIIWLGTYKQGVNYFNSDIVQFQLYNRQEKNTGSLPFEDVNCFVEDNKENIWIGTNGGGLIYFDRKANTFKQFRHNSNNINSLCNDVIVSLHIDKNNILWIGTFLGGLDKFDGKYFAHFRHNDNDSSSLSNNSVWEIYEDKDERLWIGTLGDGLDLFDRKTNRFEHFGLQKVNSDFVQSKYISCILQDRQGILWIGSAGGITSFNSKENVFVPHRNSGEREGLSNNAVICLIEDTYGRLWVGTREGLNVYNKKTNKFQSFTVDNGLPDNVILNILEDQNKSLWISTSNGLCKVITTGIEEIKELTIINYDEINDLQNREFNDNAAYKTRNGELLFGGPSGFNIINPSAIKDHTNSSKAVFTNLQLFNKNVDPGDEINGRILLKKSITQTDKISLKYNENSFSIQFTAIDFSHSNKDKFAYILDGFNPDWVYTDGNQRVATYTNLAPGNYTLKVKTMNKNGVWGDVKSLKIVITPPFWKTTIAYLFYILFLAGLLYLIRRITLERIHLRYEMKRQKHEAERSQAIEQLKTKFFTNVSHEFRTPLSLIIAPLDKLIKGTNDEEQKQQLNLVQRNAKRLLGLVNQLLDFRKMQVQEIKLHPSIGDIVGFTKDISQSFIDIAEKKTIQFSFTTDLDKLEMYFDKDKVEKIMFNLLSNAFKYTHDKGKVSVHLSYKSPTQLEMDGNVAIEVKDTGIGIPADKQQNIFERFFQTDVPGSIVNQGTGIGLAITKEFVKLHKGIITVHSELEKGTTFTVLIPAKKIFDTTNQSQKTIPIETDDIDTTQLEEGDKRNKKKTIIVVEDNEDLRFYLKDNLKEHYYVVEAVNGKEGWEKISKLMPDLVVSDIMMPVMDGIELARKIKSETHTAHIPVILLTAIGSEEKQLEGLNVGVNDYITKPFTFEILASRIRNLIAQQKLLQKKFHKQIEVNPSEITVTSVDENFLRKALEIVEKHIDLPEFSVEDLSREIFMTRVTLYRKIQFLTGKTPIEFIRSIRLKRAASLLEKSGMPISEIAWEVGFRSPKHFAKLFKEEFGVTPSQYASEKK
ncbi:MAG: two-component regulator propeller domain-containing protein, partial [Chitinophagaceae bacterium]